MEVINLGLIDYSEALKIQEEAANSIRIAIKAGSAVIPSLEKLIVCEHAPVVTIGRGINSRNEVLTDVLPIIEVARGGRATLHLPGQIVVYPVIDLNSRGRDLQSYLRILELGIIETLSDFRIEAISIKGKTGVWVSQSLKTGYARKIASIGIASKEWVSTHGLALNVNCDLNLFSNINPCGFSPETMTSMVEEMPERYKAEWVQTMGRLMKDVRGRLIENLKPRLERLDFKLTADELLLFESESGLK